jgi:type VI secretion system secreted protein VgrG
MEHRAIEARLESADFSCERIQVAKVEGREAISRLFSFTVDLVCTDPEGLHEADLVGAEASLIFEVDGVDARTVHGMIAEVEDRLETELDLRSYRIVLVPRAFRLTLVETQEVFMGLAVPAIVKQKLELVGLGASDVEMRLSGSYEPREFVVEYKETDLAFVSRLTEHVGVSFFFEHEDGRDKLIFTDQPSGFHPLPDHGTVPFRGRGEARDVYRLTHRSRLIPKRYVQQDYNYRSPRLDLTAGHKSEGGFAGGVVEYGGHFKTPDEGKALARARAEEREAANQFYTGMSDVVAFTAGARVTIEGHPHLADADLLLVEVEHHYARAVAMQSDGDQAYRCSFKAVPAGKTYRPPRVTPRPRIAGVITGIVEPEAGADVGKYAHVDDQGRYTVRFYFDTAPAGQGMKSSRPIRMIQAHAGPNYGIHFPLHPGVEVLVTFLDGDPDRPLIQGAVANPSTPAPVAARNALQSRVQTASGIYMVMKDR